MSKDRWDKAEVSGKLLAGILIPLAIFGATLLVSNSEKEVTEAHKKMDRLSTFIGPLSSDNPRERLIAVEVARFLAEQENLPAELLPTLLRIAESDENAGVARGASQAFAVSEQKTPRAVESVQTDNSEVPPRVYFHIPDEQMRAQARSIELELESRLEQMGLVVPGIERRGDQKDTQLRYFRNEEEEEAEAINDVLASLGVQAQLKNLAERYANAKIRPRHYELWFGVDAL